MKAIYTFCIVVLFFACQSDKRELLPAQEEEIIFKMATSYFQPLPEIDWQNYTPEERTRIELGKKLFYDKNLSQNKTQNCASCHDMTKFGQDNLRVSPGDGGELGLRNVPTVINAHLQYAQFWDAREKSVEGQAGGPIFGEVEMGMQDTLELYKRLSEVAEYPEMFERAFLDADTLINLENITAALGAFERTLLSPSRFDNYIRGDKYALNPIEKKGIKSFIDQGCIPCHSGVLLGGNMAQPFALFGYYWDYTNSTFLDKGRYDHTQDPSDKFVFKVPGLRNVAETAPYFHDGSISDLEESIRIMSMSELNLPMEEEHVQSITAFFRSLTGEVPSHAHENESFPWK